MLVWRYIKALFRPPWAFRLKLSVILSTISILGTMLFATLSYEASRDAALEDIDDLLCSAAVGAQQLVPPTVLLQAEREPRIEPDFTNAYRKAQTELEEYAERARLEFVWVITARPDGTAYEVVSNLSPEQQAERADPMKVLLLNPYELPPVYIDAVRTGKQRTGSAEDSYGSFRSCIIPVKFATGDTVLYGADMEITAVQNQLFRGLVTSFGIGGFVLFITLIVIGVTSRSIAKELLMAGSEASAIRRLVFFDNQKELRSTTKEIDRLFRSMAEMKTGLKAFSKYVPTAVVSQVIATGRAEVGGERRELSLLMTDVTDFTTISEQLEPERVMVVMSEYFDRVVAPILAEQGTLDKYVGDAIFAYWNAPARQPDHAILCCKAALSAREASRALAKEWEDVGRWAWHTRFGLHAGETVFGNVGAPDRMDFTVIGSSVNLASRIEGLNKFYGTEILASERVRELVGDSMVFRRVDKVMPKGALDSFEIFELLGDPSILVNDPTLRDYLNRWAQASELYAQRKWAEAHVLFSNIALTHPADKVATLYVNRTKRFISDPPSNTWDGVERFESK